MKIGVIVSGLPASGKTRTGRELAAGLGFAFLDKDAFLEDLYDRTAVRSLEDRNRLSRQSDRTFRNEAIRLGSAVLVSHWRPPGMKDQSGTPTDWLADAYDAVVEVSCCCSPKVACARFFARTRHPGHLDSVRDREELAIRMASWADRYPLGVGALVEFRTDQPADFAPVIENVRTEISRARRRLSGA